MRKVLYVPKDGAHSHDGMALDYRSDHQHPAIEREIQLLIDQIADLIEVVTMLDEQNAVLHARIDDLEQLFPE